MLYYFLQRSIRKAFALMLVVSYAVFLNAQEVHKHLEVKWAIEDEYSGKENPVSKFILHNTSNETISCSNLSLWFNFIRGINTNSVDKQFKIIHRNGDLYELTFIDKKAAIASKASLEVSFKTNGLLPNFTDAPSGLYITYNDASGIAAHPVRYTVVTNEFSIDEKLDHLANQYEINRLKESTADQKIIPSPFALRQGEGSYNVTSKSIVWGDDFFKEEVAYFREFVEKISGIRLSSSKQIKHTATIRILQDKLLEEEEYEIVIDKKGITIKASTNKGAFHAIQSIKALSPAESWNRDSGKIEIPSMTIKDKPRFAYRGLMLDVARNFQSAESIKRVIDLMAMYKLNTLHLHLNDDEGWRLEIPSLPELTEVGSVRSGSYSSGTSLQPAYGSGANAQRKLYYTVDDFKEILLYAQSRYIQVIPELETPGHARAAIKSMEARYNKFMGLGNKQEAEKYLLNDQLDRSEYSSAQNWNDNVMNVAKPSVYTFISQVLDELKGIYKSAGVPLDKVHLGGDEVPKGVWEKSPEIARLKDSLNFSSVNQVWPYYIRKVADLCKSKGLKLAGWEEMGMVNNGNGMQANPSLANEDIQVDVWNNLAGHGQEDLAYKLANPGYKVVFTSANNFYLDLAWKNTFNEPGHSWAGYTSIKKSYSFLPESYFLNIFNDTSGEKLPEGYFDKKERLTDAGRRNLIGIKGAVWSEKILNKERLEYMLLPRMLALAERAWAPKPSWETGPTFNNDTFSKDYARFINKVGTQELRKLSNLNGGYLYRLPALGIRVYEDSLSCNTEYPGFDIYFTTDNTKPTLKSAKYTQPIPLDRAKTYKFNVITIEGREGDPVILKFK